MSDRQNTSRTPQAGATEFSSRSGSTPVLPQPVVAGTYPTPAAQTSPTLGHAVAARGRRKAEGAKADSEAKADHDTQAQDAAQRHTPQSAPAPEALADTLPNPSAQAQAWANEDDAQAHSSTQNSAGGMVGFDGFVEYSRDAASTPTAPSETNAASAAQTVGAGGLTQGGLAHSPSVFSAPDLTSASVAGQSGLGGSFAAGVSASGDAAMTGASALSDTSSSTLAVLGMLAAGFAASSSSASNAVGAGDGNPVVKPRQTLTGSVYAGPVMANNQLTVLVYDEQGRLLGRDDQVDAGGKYQIDLGDYIGPVLVKVVDALDPTVQDGPDYIDEATRAPKNLEGNLTLVSVIATGDNVLNISPATTLATLLAEVDPNSDNNTAPTATVSSAANQAVAQALGLGDSAESLTQANIVTSVDAQGQANPEANAYGKMLAAISGLEANTQLSTREALLQIAQGYKDAGGTFDQATLMPLVLGAVTAQVDGVASQMGYSPEQVLSYNLSDGQLTALELATLSANQIEQLSAEQVAAFTPEAFNQLSSQQLLSLAARGALSEVPSSQVQSLSPQALALLSPQTLAALSAQDIAALSPAQVQALTAAQLDALASTKGVEQADGQALSESPLTRHTQPTLSGSWQGLLPPGSGIAVYDGDTLLGVASTSAGQWTLALDAPLGEGEHALSTRLQVPGGQAGSASASTLLSIDSVAPTLAMSPTQTQFNAEHLQQGLAALSLNVSAQDSWTLQLQGTQGTLTRSGQGSGQMQALQLSASDIDSLGQGLVQASLQASDLAGNRSNLSGVQWRIDTQAPAPTNAALALDSGEAGDALSANAALRAPSNTEAQATLEYRLAQGEQAFGAWSSSYTPPSSDDQYTVQIRQTDAAGNRSAVQTLSFTLDSTAPTPGSLSLQGLSDSGSSDTPPVTTNGNFTLSLSGNADDHAMTVTYEVSDDAGQTWAATTAAQSLVKDGIYQYRAVVTDAAGNASTTDAVSMVLDNSAPAAGTVRFVGLTDTGSSNTPPVTSDNSFELSANGASDANALSVAYEISRDGGQSWQSTPAAQTALGEGAYQFRAIVTDAAGNSSTSAASRLIIDTTAPSTGTLSLQDLQITGSDPSVWTTSDRRFTLALSGHSDSNAMSVGYEVSTDGEQSWHSTSAAQVDVADGQYSYRAVVIDAAGNRAYSASVSLVVDQRAPSFGLLQIQDLEDSGSAQDPAVTTDNNFSLLDGGAYDSSDTALGFEVSSDGGQSWSETSAQQTALADGSYLYRTLSSDALGQIGHSAAVQVTVDTTAPQAGQLQLQGLNDSGSTDNPVVATDTSFSLAVNGYSDANEVTLAYEISSDAGANWSPTTAEQTQLSDGQYQFRAVLTDAAGNASTTAATTVIVDNIAPTAGTLAFANLSDTGSTDATPVTTNGSFSLSVSGNADDNAMTVSYEVTDDGGQTWASTSATQNLVKDGIYDYRAVVTDAAGNASTSAAISMVLDNSAPTAGTLAFVGLTDTGSTDATPVTTNGSFSLSLSGNADDNAMTVTYEVSDDGGQTWASTSAAQTLVKDGIYDYRAVVTDAAGNASTSAAISMVLDNSAPAAGTLAFTGLSDTGSTDATPVTTNGSFSLSVSGNADDNAMTVTYEISDDGGQTWASTTASQNLVKDGIYDYRAVVTDAAGNASTSAAISMVLDNSAPAAGTLAFVGLTDTGSADATPVTTNGSFSLSVSGNADDNAMTVSYEVSDDGGQTWTSTTATQNLVKDGIYDYRAVVTDAAGNASTSAAISMVLDNSAPAAGTLAFVGLTDTGSSDATPVTTNGSFSLSLTGNADDNAMTVSYEVSDDGGQTWTSTTATQNLVKDGIYDYRAVVTDAAGNASTSAAISMVLDNSAPAAGTLAFVGLTDTGSADTTPVTTDDTFTLSLSGNADDNAMTVSYEVSDDGGQTWLSTSAAQNVVKDGVYQYRAVVTDAAGNTSTSSDVSMEVDNSAPGVSSVSVANGLYRVGSAVTLTVQAANNERGLTLQNGSTFNGQALTHFVDNNDGSYSMRYTVAAGDSNVADGGSVNTSIVLLDKAGNSTSIANVTLSGESIDAQAPTVSSVALTANSETTYSRLNAGDVVTATVVFSEAVTLSGGAKLKLNVGGTLVDAVCNDSDVDSGSGTTSLKFKYTLQSGQNDSDGISVDTNSLSLTIGSALTDASGNPTVLTHSAVSANNGYVVDTSNPVSAFSLVYDAYNLSTVNYTSSTVTVNSANPDFRVSLAGTGLVAGDSLSLWKDGSSLMSTTLSSTDISNGYHDFVLGSTTLAQNMSGTGYAFTAQATDSAGNVGTSTAFNVRIKLDHTNPTLQSSTPADEAGNVSVSNNLSFTFSENIVAGTGNIVIKDLSTGSVTKTIAANDSSQVSISGSTLTINPSSDLSSATNYAIRFDSNAVYDTAENAFAGINNDTTLNFSTPSLADGRAVISLGTGNGNLIAPKQIEGKWFYVWDVNADGVHNEGNGGDLKTMDWMEQTFFGSSTGSVITESNREFSMYGVRVKLVTDGISAAITDHSYLNGTAWSTATAGYNTTANSNPTYEDVTAIWDAYNGTSTLSNQPLSAGALGDWSFRYNPFLTASENGVDNHNALYVQTGDMYKMADTMPSYVAVQVL